LVARQPAHYAIIPALTPGDILPEYAGTPIEHLLRYHNLGEPLPPSYGSPALLVGMCMDHRKDLIIPNEFAYVLRSAGANLRDSSFEISYAVAIGGVSTVALLGHTDCGMVQVTRKRDSFVRGLVERAGWDPAAAARHFDRFAHRYEIRNAIEFTVTEAKRLRRQYPRLLVAPLLYTIEDDRLAQVRLTQGGETGPEEGLRAAVSASSRSQANCGETVRWHRWRCRSPTPRTVRFAGAQ
jgi:carbonic anhydrase